MAGLPFTVGCSRASTTSSGALERITYWQNECDSGVLRVVAMGSGRPTWLRKNCSFSVITVNSAIGVSTICAASRVNRSYASSGVSVSSPISRRAATRRRSLSCGSGIARGTLTVRPRVRRFLPRAAAGGVRSAHERPRSIPIGISAANRGGPGGAPQPLAVARQVVPADPALHRALLPVVRVRRGDRRRVLRDPVHGAPPARDIRLQGRRDALVLARRVLLLQRAGHGSLSAVQPRRRSRLPRTAARRVPAGAVARPGARQVVAARAPAVPRRRSLRGRCLVRRQRR